jgi:hypothetical protein
MPTEQASFPMRVFLSHSHRDRAVATDLQRVLMKFGAQTFLDQDKIQAADVLPTRIQEGIEWCDTFLLIWSSSAAASDWVSKEWIMAYERRRKIIPYCLDSTSLPPVLENLVYVDQKDAQVAHGSLLRAVFGKGFSPPSTDVFPGRWCVTLSAFGLGTATYDLELRANGQVTGSGKMDQTGIVDDLMRSIGAAELLNVRYSVSGTWEYEEHTEILTLDLTAHGLGQDAQEKVQIRTTGREVGEIQGKDLSGRTYAIRRFPEQSAPVSAPAGPAQFHVNLGGEQTLVYREGDDWYALAGDSLKILIYRTFNKERLQEQVNLARKALASGDQLEMHTGNFVFRLRMKAMETVLHRLDLTEEEFDTLSTKTIIRRMVEEGLVQ